MRDMTAAKEIVRKLRIVNMHPSLSDDDSRLLQPVVDTYKANHNPFDLTEKQAELVLTIYHKYFTP